MAVRSTTALTIEIKHAAGGEPIVILGVLSVTTDKHMLIVEWEFDKSDASRPMGKQHSTLRMPLSDVQEYRVVPIFK